MAMSAAEAAKVKAKASAAVKKKNAKGKKTPGERLAAAMKKD